MDILPAPLSPSLDTLLIVFVFFISVHSLLINMNGLLRLSPECLPRLCFKLLHVAMHISNLLLLSVGVGRKDSSFGIISLRTEHRGCVQSVSSQHRACEDTGTEFSGTVSRGPKTCFPRCTVGPCTLSHTEQMLWPLWTHRD